MHDLFTYGTLTAQVVLLSYITKTDNTRLVMN